MQESYTEARERERRTDYYLRVPVDTLLDHVLDLIASEPYWPRTGAIRRKSIAAKVAALRVLEGGE